MTYAVDMTVEDLSEKNGIEQNGVRYHWDWNKNTDNVVLTAVECVVGSFNEREINKGDKFEYDREEINRWFKSPDHPLSYY